MAAGRAVTIGNSWRRLIARKIIPLFFIIYILLSYLHFNEKEQFNDSLNSRTSWRVAGGSADVGSDLLRWRF